MMYNEILSCKCGDVPRVHTKGSYVHLFCRSCGYESMPFLNNSLADVIKSWNESHRDRERQKAGAAAFDKMMDYCKKSVGTELENKPIPRRFFSFFQHSK